MPTYYVRWSAFGIATVDANNQEEAEDTTASALGTIDDIDFNTNQVDGYEYEITTEQP